MARIIFIPPIHFRARRRRRRQQQLTSYDPQLARTRAETEIFDTEPYPPMQHNAQPNVFYYPNH